MCFISELARLKLCPKENTERESINKIVWLLAFLFFPAFLCNATGLKLHIYEILTGMTLSLLREAKENVMVKKICKNNEDGRCLL